MFPRRQFRRVFTAERLTARKPLRPMFSALGVERAVARIAATRVGHHVLGAAVEHERLREQVMQALLPFGPGDHQETDAKNESADDFAEIAARRAHEADA